MKDLTGSETVILNDHVYMKDLCKRLNEKRQVLYLFYIISYLKLSVYLERA